MKKLASLLVLVAMALVATGCGGTKTVELSASVVQPPFTVATDTLTTDQGKPFTFATDTTKPLTLVFFGYTNCPDVCPAVLSALASGLAKLTDDQRSKVQVLFITSDPNRDTGPVLHSYLERFDPSFEGLTGSLASISKVAKSVGVFVDEGEKLASGGYDPNSHSSYVIGIDSSHTAPVFWDGDTAPSQFASDFRFLLDHGTKDLEPAAGP